MTVGLPALAAAALISAALVEVVFLASPASGYCPQHGAILDYCIFPPSEIAIFTIGLALLLTGVSVLSCILAWRRRLGLASAVALPGLIGAVLALLFALGKPGAPDAGPILNTPPAGYSLYAIGGEVGFLGLILLGAACCFQLAMRVRRPS